MHYCIIGTAGHIDHGKTALIKSLTGIDTDRLKEEKERGISIDLGFAYLDLNNGIKCGIVDVPGHERFIKNMVAGAVGMDIVILVIAANEGIKPQTVEHINILRFLNIKKGIIVITKIDIATQKEIEETKEEIIKLTKGTCLEHSAVILFSAVTGTGKEEIKNLILELYESVEQRNLFAPPILPVDRAFTIAGFGTVITGTLQKGIVKTGDILEIQPQKIEVRVRNIQIHNDFSDKAFAGQRVAINLTGINKEDITRGNWLAAKNIYNPSRFIDCQFTLLESCEKPLKNRTRVRVHTGTKEVIGKIYFLEKEITEQGESQVVQLNLEEPIIASFGEPFIVRAYSPIETIGGGKVIQGEALKHKFGDEKIIEYLKNLNEGKEDDRLEYEILNKPFQSYNKLKQKIQKENIEHLILSGKVICIHDLLIHSKEYNNIKDEILKIIVNFYKINPLRIGPAAIEVTKLLIEGKYSKYKKELGNKITKEILEKMSDMLELKKGRFKLIDHEIKLSDYQNKLKTKITDEFEKNLFKPPSLSTIKEIFGKDREFKNVVSYLLEQDVLIPAGEDILFHTKAISKAKEVTVEIIKSQKKITAAQLRDRLNTNRKLAITILEYFDSKNFTKRIGDDRILV